MDAPDSTMGVPLDDTPLPTPRPRRKKRKRAGLSLFWRTFFLLALMLLGSALGWYQLFRTLEHEPRAIQSARQVASLVNLSRAALVHSDAIARVSLIKTLAEQEKVRIVPHEPGDRFDLFASNALEQRMTEELVARLGPGTLVASRVNDEPGLWVGFSIEGDSYWLLMDRSRVSALLAGGAWLLWIVTLCAVSLVGAALLARLINRPLKALAAAAARVRSGDYVGHRLDENAASREVREVNIGFNRMADQLSQIELDRAQMLAGISHDLRTPLARLRLETEMSVPDPVAREHMAADITQVDAIIDKFLDYARPEQQASPQPVNLAEIVESSAYPFSVRDDMQVLVDVPHDLRVLADEVELGRVLSNLLENARRYGKAPDTGVTTVQITASAVEQHVFVRVRDHGRGVPAEVLPKLTRPFFRGDAARTAATGAGLGLSIVAKMVQNMGGKLNLGNAIGGGLVAAIRLQRAPENRPAGAPASAPGRLAILKKKRP
ncbi:HAMP domain-containing protein [Comamonadaceae bacterium OH2545_COT-014]|nr:HAMP domain-containing protein [Comamonadaceae bacterium OH2545_COT-014]